MSYPVIVLGLPSYIFTHWFTWSSSPSCHLHSRLLSCVNVSFTIFTPYFNHSCHVFTWICKLDIVTHTLTFTLMLQFQYWRHTTWCAILWKKSVGSAIYSSWADLCRCLVKYVIILGILILSQFLVLPDLCLLSK